MNAVPPRKSLFAPENKTKSDTLSPIPADLTNSSKGNTDGAATPTWFASPPLSPFSSYEHSKASENIPFQRKTSIRRTFNAMSRPLARGSAGNNLVELEGDNGDTTPIRKLKKHGTTTVPKVPSRRIDPIPEGMQTPRLFKEYKYRASQSGEGLKGVCVDETRILKPITAISAYASNIIDTRPTSAPRRHSRKMKTEQPQPQPQPQPEPKPINDTSGSSKASSNASSEQPRPSFRASLMNTPIYVPKSRFVKAHMNVRITPASETSSDDDLSTERLRLRTKLKKGLYSVYFIGIMLSFRNKVMVYGAVRHVEYLEEFNKFTIEDAEEKEKRLLPILPSSTLNLVWGIILVFFLTLTAIFTPIYISFVDDDNQFFYYLNLFIDVGFGIDILFNFFVAYQGPNDELVTDFRKIALNYLKMWFWIDIASIIPLNEIIQAINSSEGSFNQGQKIVKLLRIPRLYKLVKILRLLKLAKLFSTNHSLNKINKKLNLNTRVIKIFRLFINFAFLNHLVGCIWFYLAKFDDFGPDTWVQRVNLVDEDVGVQYIASLYWSFQTLTTVGYGDLAPQTSLERSVSAVWIVIGVLVYSFTVGNLSAIFLSFSSQKESLKNKLVWFENFSSQANLPPFLKQKVRRFFEVNHRESVCHYVDHNDTLKSLPANLKTSLLLFSYYDYIKNISFLQIDANFTAALLLHFKVFKLIRGEMLYREDDPPNEIYFIWKGSVNFLTRRGKSIYSICEGTYFGEMEAFHETTRQCFCKATEKTLLFVCPKEIFFQTLVDFPDIKDQVEKMAKLRKRKLEERLDDILKEEDNEKQERNDTTKQIVLLKKTEYINKVLLKIPDSEVRFRMRRNRERSTIVRPTTKTSLKNLDTKNSRGSLASISDEKPSPLLLPKGLQKSLLDLITINRSPNRKKTEKEEKMKIEEVKSEDEEEKGVNFSKKQSIKESATVNKLLAKLMWKIETLLSPKNRSTTARLLTTENQLITYRKDQGTLVSEAREEKLETVSDRVMIGSFGMLLTPKKKTTSEDFKFNTRQTEEETYRRNTNEPSLIFRRERSQTKEKTKFWKKPLEFVRGLFQSLKINKFRKLPKSPNKIAPINSFTDWGDAA